MSNNTYQFINLRGYIKASASLINLTGNKRIRFYNLVRIERLLAGDITFADFCNTSSLIEHIRLNRKDK